ncbi:hypothetical protein PBY51_000988 [Eleginops maclovinus]|uniref:Uncharacterized protein n=1 Tax=Eleginops maclovinus TaxID=56733 RepID=A0AAN7XQJ4_ELEMC|nr:hypothetical protein PBY51_000988 [Eleginops maclovinus]
MKEKDRMQPWISASASRIFASSEQLWDWEGLSSCTRGERESDGNAGEMGVVGPSWQETNRTVSCRKRT